MDSNKEDYSIMEVIVFGKDNTEIKLELPEFNHKNVTCKELLIKIGDHLNVPKEELNKLFTLSLNSKYLELALKEGYKPFGILACWSDLLRTFAPKFHQLKQEEIESDQPVLSLQRNLFLAKTDEEKLDNELILKLFYEEAKSNVRNGRYQLDDEDYLAAIQLKIDYLRVNDDLLLTTQYLKENLDQYLSTNYSQSTASTFLTLNRLRITSLDQKIINLTNSQQLNLSIKDLYKLYLSKCRQLAYYGSVFYHGQIEKNQSVLTSLIKNQDLKVYVAINYEGIHIIDKKTSVRF